MAKQPASKPSFAPTSPTLSSLAPVARAVQFDCILAHPSELPVLLTQKAREGWTLAAVAPCQWNDQHAAYLTRTL